jgi:hypothetical protein
MAQNTTAVLYVRIPQDLHTWLQEEARKNHRKMSGQVAHMIAVEKDRQGE